ncbi:hypothetical protein ACFFIY_07860 [Bhargavaea ullalensis]|uniref:Uncharacterized protein n=1 Tax=Bhargavaea ullalensis TaxID=1265685 RepID=A0ABV2GEF4_9BACL
MYDPTIFDNLKVALENRIYDLDTIERRIDILDRADIMDFAALSRALTVRFKLAGSSGIPAEVSLFADGNDLAGEILETPGSEPACTLTVRFETEVREPAEECPEIGRVLNGIWEDGVRLTQTLSWTYPAVPAVITNNIDVRFLTRIGEENMGELDGFLDSVLHAMDKLRSLR